MLNMMIHLAVIGHENQVDQSGKPYILHCLKVMDLLQTQDIELMCVAIGHDLFEDTDITEADLIVEGISGRVVEGIKALTKVPGESYEDYKNKVKSNKDAIKVKMADLKHNTDITRLKGVTQKDMDRTLRYYEFYLELYKINT